MIYTDLLTTDKDPMGTAILDYLEHGKADKLRVFSSQFDEDEIPVRTLFRTEKQMAPLERTALQLATGRILDVGAGSGCHSLILQAAGKEVEAIDISPLSVEAMRRRGVKQVTQANLFNESFCGSYDTLLMLMNGSGIIGRLENLPAFFRKAKQLLRPGGSILMDSSDLRYLYEDEDGSFVIDIAGDYYGEVDFKMQYKDIIGDQFDWLYIDFQTLSLYAAQNGFEAELVKEGKKLESLLGQHLVYLFDQPLEFFRIVQTGQHNDFPVTVYQHITGNARLSLRIEGKDIGPRIQSQRIGHFGSLSESYDFLQRFVAVDTHQIKLCFCQMSFSINGISLRHTPHQLAVNWSITTLPRRLDSFTLCPSVNFTVKSGACSPTLTIYPLASACFS